MRRFPKFLNLMINIENNMIGGWGMLKINLIILDNLRSHFKIFNFNSLFRTINVKSAHVDTHIFASSLPRNIQY